MKLNIENIWSKIYCLLLFHSFSQLVLEFKVYGDTEMRMHKPWHSSTPASTDSAQEPFLCGSHGGVMNDTSQEQALINIYLLSLFYTSQQGCHSLKKYAPRFALVHLVP